MCLAPLIFFAVSTILGWEYHGEKAFEYLLGTHKYNMVYRVLFCLVAYFGCTQTLSLVWNFSDIANALMAIPNLICLLLLSGEIAKDMLSEYRAYLSSGHIFDQLVLNSVRPDDECVDYRKLPWTIF